MRLALLGVISVIAGALAAQPAAAIIVHLPGHKAASYFPLRGARSPVRGEPLFSNLDYSGGPVMPSNTNYTLYWAPQGAPSYPSDYKSGVDRYFTDLAHDSGKVGNTDSVATQYNDWYGNIAAYNSTFGGRLDDTDKYPASACTGASVCLTDQQIQAELGNYLDAHGLPRDLRHEYFVLTPPGVQICFQPDGSNGGCSAGSSVDPAFCAYHSNGQAGQEFVYAVDPYVTGNAGCDDGNHPNGTSSDGVIEGGLSHEHIESITDPEPNDAWTDLTGQGEIGDKCAQAMGSSFGTAPNGASYNQVINGDLYWYQEEWSNQTHQCLQRLKLAVPLPTSTFTASSAGVLTTSFDASASSAPGGVATYDWQFNDGSDPTSPPAPIETSSPVITHTFPGPGTYLVALTVFGPDGSSTGFAQRVTVTDLPQMANGWTASDFATDFASTRLGPTGIVADGSNDLYVVNTPESLLYKFGPSGGVASVDTQLSTLPIGYWPLGLAFGKDGALYAAINGDNEVVELDPDTGAVKRTLAYINSPLGLATDPVSGDLMVTSDGDGGVDRISDLSAQAPTVTQYATGMGAPDGISAAPDGTFYVADGGTIDRVEGTGSQNAGTVSYVASVPGADGVAVAANPVNPAAPAFVVVNSNYGTLSKVDLSAPNATPTDIFTGGSRGDFVTVAPDGCLYATQTSAVLRVSESSPSGCPFAPISPFQPPAAQPYVPGPVTASSVVLRASVNPHGAPTTFHFEFGRDAGYGTSTPETDAGSSSQPVTVSQTVTNLSPGTAYHYRIVARNQAGTMYGPDEQVSTSQQAGAPAPTVTVLPRIQGQATPGHVLSCNIGTWLNATDFSVAWLRDAGTASYSPTYRVLSTDSGHRLSCRIGARGPGGSASADSAPVTVSSANDRSFTIRLFARRLGHKALRRGIAQATVRVPRACSVTVRLILVRYHKGHRAVAVLRSQRIQFRARGIRSLRFVLSRRYLRELTGRFYLRVVALGSSGSLRSSPVSRLLAH